MPHEFEIHGLTADDRFAVVVSRWNLSVTRQLLEGAVTTLVEAGVASDAIDVAWVPGTFEIPLVAERLAGNGNYAAVLCLGAVVRGETSHDRYINHTVSTAISEIGRKFELPVLFGVLTCETMEQAVNRAGGRVGNKGSECAAAAIQMVGWLQDRPASGE